MSGTRRRCPDGHVARSSATRRARSSTAAMKGNARKIGRPPPGDPPAPAADALAPAGGDIGRLRLGRHPRRRPARGGLRLSRVVPRGGRCASVRRARARGDRAEYPVGGVRRGWAAALGAEGDPVAGRGGDRRRGRSSQGGARRRCALVPERDVDRPFGRGSGGELRGKRLRRCLDDDRGNRDTDGRRRHGDRRSRQRHRGELDRRQRDRGSRRPRSQWSSASRDRCRRGSRAESTHSYSMDDTDRQFRRDTDLNFFRSSRSMSTNSGTILLQNPSVIPPE